MHRYLSDWVIDSHDVVHPCISLKGGQKSDLWLLGLVSLKVMAIDLEVDIPHRGSCHVYLIGVIKSNIAASSTRDLTRVACSTH